MAALPAQSAWLLSKGIDRLVGKGTQSNMSCLWSNQAAVQQNVLHISRRFHTVYACVLTRSLDGLQQPWILRSVLLHFHFYGPSPHLGSGAAVSSGAASRCCKSQSWQLLHIIN
jgi:hypothetical protein